MKKTFSLLKIFLIIAAIITLFVRGCKCEKEVIEAGPEWDLWPTAIFTIYPANGSTGILFEFDAKDSYDDNRGDPDTVLHVRWDWEGDGTWDTPYSLDKYAHHTYTTAGEYQVTLEVLDTDGYTGDAKKELIVTSSGLPTVATDNATNITGTTATCGGEVIDEGSSAVTSRGVCWDLYENPTVYDDLTNDGNGPGTFISSITELTPDATYYVRAYAKNDLGTVYGEQKTFKTDTAGGIPCPGIPTITWQGKTYNTVLIGDQCWMRSNLNWETETGISWCYNDDPANCALYGRLYDWETMMNGEGGSISVPSGVQGICPDGWHIPSDEEWKILEGVVDPSTLVGDTIWDEFGWRGYHVGRFLKSKTGWLFNNGTNKYNFTAYPGGYRLEDGTFHMHVSWGYFWSCTEAYSNYAYLRSLRSESDQSNREINSKAYGYSVRCLKD